MNKYSKNKHFKHTLKEDEEDTPIIVYVALSVVFIFPSVLVCLMQ